MMPIPNKKIAIKINAVSRLKEIGYEQTYDWTQNNRASSLEALQKIGLLEKKAVIEADFLIVLTPAGKGSHIELGMAIGMLLGKRQAPYIV